MGGSEYSELGIFSVFSPVLTLWFTEVVVFQNGIFIYLLVFACTNVCMVQVNTLHHDTLAEYDLHQQTASRPFKTVFLILFFFRLHYTTQGIGYINKRRASILVVAGKGIK